MTNEEIEREWQKELKSFLEEHTRKMKSMTTEEETNKYIRENKVNEKLKELQQKFQEKYSTQK